MNTGDRLKIDMHNHSVASGHAINTVYELVHSAKEKGLTHIGITEHGPSMEGAPTEGYFEISDQLVHVKGIEVFLGIEANIINEAGDIDLGQELLERQRIVAAGLHAKTPYERLNRPDNTKSIINAMKNPYVKIITHPYRPEFPVDVEKIVRTSYETDTLLEINDNLFKKRVCLPELLDRYSEMIKLCKKYNLLVIIGSDAHLAENVGSMRYILPIKEKIGLDDDIIINYKPELIMNYILAKKVQNGF